MTTATRKVAFFRKYWCIFHILKYMTFRWIDISKRISVIKIQIFNFRKVWEYDKGISMYFLKKSYLEQRWCNNFCQFYHILRTLGDWKNFQSCLFQLHVVLKKYYFSFLWSNSNFSVNFILGKPFVSMHGLPNAPALKVSKFRKQTWKGNTKNIHFKLWSAWRTSSNRNVRKMKSRLPFGIFLSNHNIEINLITYLPGSATETCIIQEYSWCHF